MRKCCVAVWLLLVVVGAHAQTTVVDSFMHGGIMRTYSFYVPAAYVPGQAVPLVLNLHGFSTDGAYQAQYRSFSAIADTANFIVAHPDGTEEQFTNQRFWNYGNVAGSTVDDVGFLEALIDTIAAHYTVNPRRVYSAGISNGGFMNYYLACGSNRFAAIGSVAGSMSVDMYNSCNPARAIPTIHIHGTSDGVNPYTGNSTMKAIEDVSLFWANRNGCDTTPTVIPIANTSTSDNATAERYLYAGGVNGHTVERFKVIDGGHTWPGQYVFTLSGNTCMDFSASKEMWRFFSQYEIPVATAIEDNEDIQLKLWPNPAQQYVYVQAANRLVTGVTIVDIQGREVIKQAKENIQLININQLNAGSYIAKISGIGFNEVRRLLIL